MAIDHAFYRRTRRTMFAHVGKGIQTLDLIFSWSAAIIVPLSLRPLAKLAMIHDNFLMKLKSSQMSWTLV